MVLPVIYPVRAGIPIVGDFWMPVGTTGIVFVAALSGTSSASGPTVFPVDAQAAAYLRAGSTLARWGMVNPQFFAFIRLAMGMSQADVATFLDIPLVDVQAYESGTLLIPRSIWVRLADEICLRDPRPGLAHLSLQPDLRPRQIRIHPDVPQQTEQPVVSPPSC